MSTADNFTHMGWFPFCVADQSAYYASSDFDSIGNLSATAVMAFLWNLEAFTITTAGSATSGGGTTSGVSSTVINPIGGSPWNQAASGLDGAWYEFFGSALYASCPGLKDPFERVCVTGDPDHGVIANITWDKSTDSSSFFTLRAAIGLDPSNPGKYILYYAFRCDVPIGSGPALSFANPAQNTGAVIGSGTFTMGGFTFNWEATDFGTSTSHSGLGISATSSFFTY